MTTSALLEEARQLNVSERVLLVEDLWDSIIPEADDIPLGEEQRAELDRRLTAYREDPQAGSSWSDVRRRVESA